MQKDIPAISKCLSPDFKWRPPDRLTYLDRAAALKEMKRRFKLQGGPAFSDSRFRVEGTTIIQTYRVALKTPEGKVQKSRGLDVYEIRNGLIARKDAYWKRI